MTEGHKHRIIKVKKDGLVFRALRKPLFFEYDRDYVECSPYPYGVIFDPKGEVYYLSALSILHRWIGLTLKTQETP